MSQPARAYPNIYGGWIGGLIALLVLIGVFVLAITNQMETREALLIGALALAVILR
jgi:predicted lipid-binding transport protein (Tim44 family)